MYNFIKYFSLSILFPAMAYAQLGGGSTGLVINANNSSVVPGVLTSIPVSISSDINETVGRISIVGASAVGSESCVRAYVGPVDSCNFTLEGTFSSNKSVRITLYKEDRSRVIKTIQVIVDTRDRDLSGKLSVKLNNRVDIVGTLDLGTRVVKNDLVSKIYVRNTSRNLMAPLSISSSDSNYSIEENECEGQSLAYRNICTFVVRYNYVDTNPSQVYSSVISIAPSSGSVSSEDFTITGDFTIFRLRTTFALSGSLVKDIPETIGTAKITNVNLRETHASTEKEITFDNYYFNMSNVGEMRDFGTGQDFPYALSNSSSLIKSASIIVSGLSTNTQIKQALEATPGNNWVDVLPNGSSNPRMRLSSNLALSTENIRNLYLNNEADINLCLSVGGVAYTRHTRRYTNLMDTVPYYNVIDLECRGHFVSLSIAYFVLRSSNFSDTTVYNDLFELFSAYNVPEIISDISSLNVTFTDLADYYPEYHSAMRDYVIQKTE